MSNLRIETSDGVPVFAPASSLGQDAVLDNEQRAMLDAAYQQLMRACGALSQAELMLCALGADAGQVSFSLEGARAQRVQLGNFLARCEVRTLLSRRGLDRGQVISTT